MTKTCANKPLKRSTNTRASLSSITIVPSARSQTFSLSNLRLPALLSARKEALVCKRRWISRSWTTTTVTKSRQIGPKPGPIMTTRAGTTEQIQEAMGPFLGMCRAFYGRKLWLRTKSSWIRSRIWWPRGDLGSLRPRTTTRRHCDSSHEAKCAHLSLINLYQT